MNGRPCSLFYGQVLADHQADFTTPLPKFRGSFRPYAHCGYTPLEFADTLTALAEGRVDVAPLVTDIIDLADVPDAFRDVVVRYRAHPAGAHALRMFRLHRGSRRIPGEPRIDAEPPHGVYRNAPEERRRGGGSGGSGGGLGPGVV